MTTEKQPASANTSSQFVLQKIYLKDVSFESPAPTEFFAQARFTPEINIQLNTESSKLSEDVYEVILDITVTAKSKEQEKMAYLVEVKQAGIFTVARFTKEDFGFMINSYCPSILFPYAREAISGLVERGGFPQLLLAPINFEALYRDHLAKIKKAEPPISDARH